MGTPLGGRTTGAMYNQVRQTAISTGSRGKWSNSPRALLRLGPVGDGADRNVEGGGTRGAGGLTLNFDARALLHRRVAEFTSGSSTGTAIRR